jgi:DoxX-like family
MNGVLWIASGVLAAVFFGVGIMKLQPKEKLVASGLHALEAFSPIAIKGLAVAEILGALGLVLPALFDVATILVPVSAVCLAIVLVGATVAHVRLKDYRGAIVPVVLALLAVFVAWGRFGPYAF